MAYNHLTTKELTLIESYWEIGYKGTRIAQKIKQSKQTIYNVLRFLNDGGTLVDYMAQYHIKANKQWCGAKTKGFSKEQVRYINKKTRRWLDTECDPWQRRHRSGLLHKTPLSPLQR